MSQNFIFRTNIFKQNKYIIKKVYMVIFSPFLTHFDIFDCSFLPKKTNIFSFVFVINNSLSGICKFN